MHFPTENQNFIANLRRISGILGSSACERGTGGQIFQFVRTCFDILSCCRNFTSRRALVIAHYSPIHEKPMDEYLLHGFFDTIYQYFMDAFERQPLH